MDGDTLATVVTAICDTYLEGIPFSFAVGSTGHQLVRSFILYIHYTYYYIQVNQRISDGWRNPIGSSAIAIVMSMLEDTFPDSDKDRQVFARQLLDKKRFIFRSTKGDEHKVRLIHFVAISRC